MNNSLDDLVNVVWDIMGKHLGMFTGKEQAQVQTLPAQIQVTFGELKQHIEEIGQ